MPDPRQELAKLLTSPPPDRTPGLPNVWRPYSDEPIIGDPGVVELLKQLRQVTGVPTAGKGVKAITTIPSGSLQALYQGKLGIDARQGNTLGEYIPPNDPYGSKGNRDTIYINPLALQGGDLAQGPSTNLTTLAHELAHYTDFHQNSPEGVGGMYQQYGLTPAIHSATEARGRRVGDLLSQLIINNRGGR